MNKPRGFTLIELLVVLVILVTLTAVAATSLEGVQDQSRFDMTTRQMNEIHDAITGAKNLKQVDGTPIMSGFVADVGGVPATLDDLIKPPADSNALYASAKVFADSISYSPANTYFVAVPRGWRSYLRLGPGQSTLADGWGNAFSYTVGADPVVLMSQGPDVNVSTDDLIVNIPTSEFLVSSVSFQVNVKPSSTNAYKVVAVVYGPDADQSNPAVRIWWQSNDVAVPNSGVDNSSGFIIDGTTQTSPPTIPTAQYLYNIAAASTAPIPPLSQSQYKNMTAGTRVLWVRVERGGAIVGSCTPISFQATAGAVPLGTISIAVP